MLNQGLIHQGEIEFAHSSKKKFSLLKTKTNKACECNTFEIDTARDKCPTLML